MNSTFNFQNSKLGNFFHRNSLLTGIVAELGSQLLFAVLLYVVLIIVGESPAQHLRWFGGAFIPGLLVLRYYAKKKDYLLTTKTCITTFFITFIAFIFLIFKLHLM